MFNIQTPNISMSEAAEHFWKWEGWVITDHRPWGYPVRKGGGGWHNDYFLLLLNLQKLGDNTGHPPTQKVEGYVPHPPSPSLGADSPSSHGCLSLGPPFHSAANHSASFTAPYLDWTALWLAIEQRGGRVLGGGSPFPPRLVVVLPGFAALTVRLFWDSGCRRSSEEKNTSAGRIILGYEACLAKKVEVLQPPPPGSATHARDASNIVRNDGRIIYKFMNLYEDENRF